MKLSEAIRLGSMMKPHVRRSLYSPRGTCALGAALDAVGYTDPGRRTAVCVDTYIQSTWPIAKVCVPHPARAGSTPILMSAVISLNDEHGWTREQIADWVEQIEAQQAADAPTREPADLLAIAQHQESRD